MHGTHDQRKRGAMSSAASEWVDGVRLIKSAIPMRVVAFFQAPTHLARLAQALLVGSLLNCQSGPIKPEGSSDTGGLTGAASATGSISSKTGAPGAAPLVVTLANGTTIRVPNGLRKKDTSARSLPPEIAQMQVFTWPGGDRLLSISEMLKDEKKASARIDALLARDAEAGGGGPSRAVWRRSVQTRGATPWMGAKAGF